MAIAIIFYHEHFMNYFFFLGFTCSPAFLASESPIAIACFLFFTIGPFLEPEWSFRSANSSITFFILFIFGLAFAILLLQCLHLAMLFFFIIIPLLMRQYRDYQNNPP